MARISQEAIAESAAALQDGDVQSAFAVRNRFYNQASGTFDDSILRVMAHILNSTPALLADCPQSALYPLRIAAALMELWGSSRIRDFVTIEGELDYRFGTDAIAFMMLFHGEFLRSLEDFRTAGISTVEILGLKTGDDCAACRAADGKRFTVETVPELPLADCTCNNKYGCQLALLAVE